MLFYEECFFLSAHRLMFLCCYIIRSATGFLKEYMFAIPMQYDVWIIIFHGGNKVGIKVGGKAWFLKPRFKVKTKLTVPRKKISIVIVGGFGTPSSRSHIFILSMIDPCSNFIENISLKYPSAEDSADVLHSAFCWKGFPDAILSNNGIHFISRTICSFTDMLSISQLFSSRHNPQSNGVIKPSIVA